MSRGVPVDAGVITADGTRAEHQWLRCRPTGPRSRRNSRPVTVDLDGLGRYRVVARHSRSGETIVTGLPTVGVDDTLLSVLVDLRRAGRRSRWPRRSSRAS